MHKYKNNAASFIENKTKKRKDTHVAEHTYGSANKPIEGTVKCSRASSRVSAKGFFSQAQSNMVVQIKAARVREIGFPINLKLYPPFISQAKGNCSNAPQLFDSGIRSAKLHHITFTGDCCHTGGWKSKSLEEK